MFKSLVALCLLSSIPKDIVQLSLTYIIPLLGSDPFISILGLILPLFIKYKLVTSWLLFFCNWQLFSTDLTTCSTVALKAPALASSKIFEIVGIAINAIIPKIKITANNSIRVKPFFVLSPIIIITQKRYSIEYLLNY